MTTLSVFKPVPIEIVDKKKSIYYFNSKYASIISTVTNMKTLIKTNKSVLNDTTPEESNISSPKPEKRELTVKAKRDSTNRDACQQMFLIALLLHMNYSIILRKPRKKSTKTLQLFVIDRIMNSEGNLVFDINNFSSNSSDEKINRRNLDSYTNSTMIKLLENHNAYFEIKKGKKAEKTSQFDRIERVNIENQNYGYSHIKNIGLSMNEIIRNNIQSNNFVFRQNEILSLCM